MDFGFTQPWQAWVTEKSQRIHSGQSGATCLDRDRRALDRFCNSRSLSLVTMKKNTPTDKNLPRPIPNDSTHLRTVTVTYLRLLMDYCQQQGVSSSALLSQAGLAIDFDNNDEEARIPFADFMMLCEHAQRLLGDDDLALKVGACIRPGHYGIHGHSVMSARTMGECLDRSLRYHALVHNAARNVLLHEGDLAVMCYECTLPGLTDLGRFQNELCLSAWTAFARWVTGLADYTASWMSFTHPAPTSTLLHEALFRCPLEFSATRNAVAFPARFLDLPNPQANPTVLRIMDELSERALLLHAPNAEPEWLPAARHFIARQLQDGLPTLESLAQGIGHSPNTLRNTLKKHGLLLSDVLDDTRKTLALGYLHDPALPLADIGYLLGFSEQSAFTRAFKRWTGQSPGGYRQSSRKRD